MSDLMHLLLLPRDAWPVRGVFALKLRSCTLERTLAEAKGGDAQQAEVAWRRFQQTVDLINSLFCPEPSRAFALRCLVEPHADFAAGTVTVALLARVEGPDPAAVNDLAQHLCIELMALLGGSFADYAWQPVTDAAEFERIWEPFPWDAADVVELRRREGRVELQAVRPRPTLGRGRGQAPEPAAAAADDSVYLVHQFVPRPTTFSRLLRTMLLHSAPVMLHVGLQPVRLTPAEEQGLTDEIVKCEAAAERRRHDSHHALGHAAAIHETRAATLVDGLLRQLLRLQDAPYLLQVMLASPQPVPPTLLEATGVELTCSVGEEHRPSLQPSAARTHMGGYDVVRPADEAMLHRARRNLAEFAFEPWGATQSPPALQRLRWLVDAHEAACAFRFPIATADGLPGIDVRASRTLPLPLEVARLHEGGGLLLGHNPYLGRTHDVLLSARDRAQHMYVVGQTGTGKTTLLKHMILADAAAGAGLMVIDPHGDLIDELLQTMPRSRRDDVVILDPSDVAHPVGLNLLECSDARERHFVAREMRSIMERLITDQYGPQAASFAGPIFYQHLQMNLLLAMSNPDDPGTLLEFYELYQHKEYWRRWLPLGWHDALLRRWTETTLPKMNYTQRYSEGFSWGEYLSSKFDDFVFDPRLRLVFGQKRSTINLRRILDDGQILLVRLAKGELTEPNARFLGMMLMSKLQAVALSRIDLLPQQRRPFYCYVDEFQSLATGSFVSLLSEARKFGFGLVLANQFVRQIDERIVQSVFGNVGTLVSFRVGPEDAAMLQSQFAPQFDALDLVNLPNWHACVRTTVAGQRAAPYSLRTIPPAGHGDPALATLLRETSRRRDGRPRAQVEEEIACSLAPKPEEAPVQLG